MQKYTVKRAAAYAAAISLLAIILFAGLQIHARPGGGPGGENPMCAQDQELCDLMQEHRTLCQDNAQYCLSLADRASGKPPAGKPPQGKPPKGGRNGMMPDAEARNAMKVSMKQQLAFSKSFKKLCEDGDPSACAAVRGAVDFLSANKSAVLPKSDETKDPGAGMQQTMQIASGLAVELTNVTQTCMKSGAACKTLTDQLSLETERWSVLSKDCKKNDAACSALRTGVKNYAKIEDDK